MGLSAVNESVLLSILPLFTKSRAVYLLTSFHKVQGGVLANAGVRTGDDGRLAVQPRFARVFGTAHHLLYKCVSPLNSCKRYSH